MKYDYLYNIFRNDEIKVILPEDCNDPLEFVPKGCSGPVGNELHGMICFSEDPRNSAMWGHYADKHKGICLEFEFEKMGTHCLYEIDGNPLPLHFNVLKITGHATKCCIYGIGVHYPLGADFHHDYLTRAIMIPVQYEEKRAEFSPYDYFPLTKPDTPITDKIFIAPHAYTKSKDWEYEKEHRLFVRIVRDTIHRDGLYFITDMTKYVSRIIVGSKCNKKYEEIRRIIGDANAQRKRPLSTLPSIAEAHYFTSDEYYRMYILNYTDGSYSLGTTSKTELVKPNNTHYGADSYSCNNL